MKSPNELLQELKELLTNLEKDADKSTRGMKAAGIRFRAAMQKVRDLAISARKSVLEYRNDSSKKEEVLEEAPVVEAVQVEENVEFDLFEQFSDTKHEEEKTEIKLYEDAPAETETVEEEDRSLLYWYNKFSY